MTRPTTHLSMMSILVLLVLAVSSVHAGEPPMPPFQQQTQSPQQFQQQFQQQFDQNLRGSGNRNSSGLSSFGNIALTAAGTIVAGLFGSQFGTVGTVLGGTVGFFVSRWIADELFPQNSAYGCNYGQSYWGSSRSGQGQSQWGQSPYSQVPFGNGSKWSTTSTDSGPVSQCGSDTDLKTLQYNYIRTYNDFKNCSTKGDEAARQRAKTLYDQAREAYYSGKNSSFH
jgi:hypothetical protein